ncbi:hypothetical protein WJX74_000010 [Apatococcus lobatus]|uniref:rRNA adenine N(6)-methyltransferase n=1 Tax=Apatococcus lobatus TaxID=904363 RepID=A0AAW1RD76_9CHLO
MRNLGMLPAKSLGQNFLTDDALLQSIAAAARLQPGDRVLEIGPGKGSLTQQLLQAGASVLAVEKDARLVKQLQSSYGQRADFRVIEEDFLTLDLSQASQLHPAKAHGRLIAAGNLPYYITTETIKKLLPWGHTFSALHFVIQDDAAKRLVSPDASEVRAINVEIDFYSEPKYLFKIDKARFSPEPTVDGALVHFELRQPSEYLLTEGRTSFMKLVQHAYLQRRKMLRKSLESLYSRAQLDKAQERLGSKCSLAARPQELSMAHLVHIFTVLQEAKHSTFMSDQS